MIKQTSSLIQGVLIFILSLTLVSCQKPSPSSDSKAAQSPAEVNLSIWSNYISPKTLEKFTAETGIKVNVSNYSSNEELLAKLKAGATGIDVAVPSDYMVFAMAQLKMLEPLEQAKIPHWADMDSHLMAKSFDPTNAYSLPWSWGTTGIAVHQGLYQGNVKGWKDLFSNPALAGKFTLLDDVRETLGAALKVNGFSLNSTNPAEIQKAQATLKGLRSKVKAFSSETISGLTNSEMSVAHAFSCDALQARAKLNGKLTYVIPEEGCTQWVDNLVIPKGTQNKEAAYALVNFLLSPEVGAERAQTLYSAPANKKSLDLLPAELKNDSALFPSAQALAKCEMIQDLGESLVTWDQAWTTLKASNE